jgi:hypothetical protein
MDGDTDDDDDVVVVLSKAKLSSILYTSRDSH